jgi:predicted RNA-binding protein YlqC (UPF0109 family)
VLYRHLRSGRQPGNCINACREILVLTNKGKPMDIPLKVLVPNSYMGRIFGHKGAIIKAIQKESNTSIHVSDIDVVRVITVKGELENMIKAIEIIHATAESAFESGSLCGSCGLARSFPTQVLISRSSTRLHEI